MIHWKEGKDLVGGRGYDEEEVESFFSLFKAPVKPEGSDGEEMRRYQWLLELDFDYGGVFKDKVIPYALHWYTGEATLYEDEEEEDEEHEKEEDESEDDDEESEDDKDDVSDGDDSGED